MKKKFKIKTKNLLSNKSNDEQDYNKKLSFEYNSFIYFKMYQINSKANFSHKPNKNNINSFQSNYLKIKKKNCFQIFCFILSILISRISAEKVLTYRKLNNDNIIKLIIKDEGSQKILGSNLFLLMKNIMQTYNAYF